MGELAALGCALLWALSSTLVGSQSGRVPTAVIGAVQLLTSTLLLWVLAGGLLFSGAIQGTDLPTGLILVTTALVGPGLGDLLYYLSIRLLGVGRSFAIAMAASPLFTIALAAAIADEPITLPVLLGALLVIAGIVLLTWRASSSADGLRSASRGALAVVLVAALCWAVSTVVLRLAADDVAAPLVSAIRMPAAAVFALVLARASGASFRPGRYGARSLVTLGAAGLLGTGFGSILYVLAVQQAGAGRTAVLSSTAPLFALPLAALLLQERVTRRVAAGTALSVAGIWLVVL